MIDISIIIVTYNYGEYICECINSCIRQKLNVLNCEIIVIDDGSNDDTKRKIESNFHKLVKYYRINNSGIEIASNYGFAKARGKYIVRVDADDRLSSNYLFEISKYLKMDYSFFFSNYKVINKQGDLIGKVQLPNFSKSEIFQRGDFLASGTVYKSSLIKKYGGYQTKLKNCGLENYELIIRIIKSDYIGFRIPEFLFFYRIHNNNMSSTKKNKIMNYGQELFNKYNLGKYVRNKFHPHGQY